MEFLESLSTNAFFLGFVGGLVPDLLRVVGSRYEKAPDYLSRPYFWISLLLLGLIGGATSRYLVHDPANELIQALAVGFSAPAIISKLLSTSGPAEAPPAPGSPGVRGAQSERPSIASKLRSWWAH